MSARTPARDVRKITVFVDGKNVGTVTGCTSLRDMDNAQACREHCNTVVSKVMALLPRGGASALYSVENHIELSPVEEVFDDLFGFPVRRALPAHEAFRMADDDTATIWLSSSQQKKMRGKSKKSSGNTGPGQRGKRADASPV